MRVGGDSPFHLSYGTLTTGEGWSDGFEQLKQLVPALKARLSPRAPFALGLRLSAAAAEALEQPEVLREFQCWLRDNDCYISSLNGACYRTPVREDGKDAHLRPDWTEAARLDYTLRLARLLAALLPPELDSGSVSTLPLSYKPWFEHEPAALAKVRRAACERLAELTAALVRLSDQSGKLIHIDLEPEPDCVLETSEETARFFTHWLMPVGGPALARTLGISVAAAQDLLRTHIGVCYDIGHFAVGFEKPGLVIARLRKAGVRVGKAQLSSALRVPLPSGAAARSALARQLRPLAESGRLHQVVGRGLNGLYHYQDLSAAMAVLHQERGEEWRINVHAPLFQAEYGELATTRQDVIDALPLLRAATGCRILEIETHDWQLLPEALQGQSPAEQVQREYEWVTARVAAAERPSHAL
jgi:hypothetical protein